MTFFLEAFKGCKGKQHLSPYGGIGMLHHRAVEIDRNGFGFFVEYTLHRAILKGLARKDLIGEDRSVEGVLGINAHDRNLCLVIHNMFAFCFRCR